jgi:hypothetical protein
MNPEGLRPSYCKKDKGKKSFDQLKEDCRSVIRTGIRMRSLQIRSY